MACRSLARQVLGRTTALSRRSSCMHVLPRCRTPGPMQSSKQYTSGAAVAMATNHPQTPTPAVRADTLPHHTVVEFDEKHTRTFSNAWLRDHCRCPECLNASTLQRSFDSKHLPPPTSLKLLDSSCEDCSLVLTIGENDGKKHDCIFPIEFLTSLIRSGSPNMALSTVKTWTADSLIANRPTSALTLASTIDANKSLLASENSPVSSFSILAQQPQRIRDQLKRYGIAFVSDVPAHPDRERWKPVVNGIVRDYIGFPRETFWGLFWDTAGSELPDYDSDVPPDTAYTTDALMVHADGCYLRDSPELQVFLCVTKSSGSNKQGASTFLDTFAAASLLYTTDPDAFWFFATTPLPFHSTHTGVETLASGPVFELPLGISRHSWETSGNVEECPPIKRFRYNNDDRAPFLHLDADTADSFYTYLPALLEVLRSPDLTLNIQLGVGDMAIVNNHRVLHGRTAFVDPRRKLVGCYAEASEIDTVHLKH